MSIRENYESQVRSSIQFAIEQAVERDENQADYIPDFYHSFYGFINRLTDIKKELQSCLDERIYELDEEIDNKKQEIEQENDNETIENLNSELEELQSDYDDLQDENRILERFGLAIDEFDNNNGDNDDLESISNIADELRNTNYLNYKMESEINNIFISIKKWKNSPVNPKNLDNALNKVFAPISDEKLSQIVASHTFQNWYQSEQVSWELKENNKTPKIFYRGLNDIDNADELKASNQYGEYAGEYYADDPATAASYIEEFANGKIIAGFLNIPQEKLAVIDCNGHSWNNIRSYNNISDHCQQFLELNFNKKFDSWDNLNEIHTVRYNHTDDTISFYLLFADDDNPDLKIGIELVVDKNFEEQDYAEKFLHYSWADKMNTTNFFSWNLAVRGEYWAVMFENVIDDGGHNQQALETQVTPCNVICAFAPTAYFKEVRNHGDFNPDDRRIFYSLFEIEEDFKQELKTEKDKTMQQTQATQQTAAQGGFSLPKNPENTVNYDLRGLPEFSGSVSAYFNNPKRQELVLAFLKTAERSKDLRSQVFLGIPYEEQKQFDRIAAFSPLELSAILDCKPEFANNLREYIAVVEDFERNHQQKFEDFKKALQALKISPKYQAATIRNRIFDENDLRKEYIDGGKAFAFTKTGEITNGDRLKQAIANAIDAIAPAVKYSLSQTEFWQERDDKAFIKQSQIRDLLRSQMSFPAEMVEVKTLHQIWNDDRDMHDTISKSTAGFFTPKNGKTVVIADAFIENPELAVFTAYHELGHRGIELQGRELWNEWLEKARQNPTVRAIADHTQVHYAAKGNILSDIAATEEALVEVFAAYKTQNWDYLAQRHKVEIPQEFRQPQGTAAKLWQSAKNKIGQIFGRQPETLPDSAVFAMLGKLEQSLYQFPEWKQKLEKTVRVGQHNPFVVAKQPIISGRPRVNPTALTNRYRNGGLRFDLNEQEQAMKSSQEILAEVMSKYETPIDNKDGLMNRPLHWLSAAELEDRRTVLSCRIDKAIQNSDSKTEERLDLEYINVENEMARRKTLSDNLKEVLESQSETLSVRDFVVLSESFEELLRQINKYDENSVIREVIRQELVAIRARMDGWKQPETLSIDDKLAMTEQKLRKINMDIDNRVYDYGVDDKTVQNYIAYRTELLEDLETMKEQAATQGGVSLDDKNSRHANLFLSATKALLYRDLENAVRWHNHFIEESKEIPVPQSVIDMQTKRIEEYSKELNERLYGDERQKYRDMFPEQIEKIKQDFKKMLENLETSPENTVKQDAFGLPEKEKNMQAIEQRYYAQKPANAISYEEFKQEMAKQNSKGIDDFVMKHYYFRDEFQDSVYQYEENGKGKFHANFVSTFEFHFEPTEKTYLVQAPFEWAKEIAKDELHRFEKRVTNAMVETSNERLNRKDLPELLGEYNTVKEETARFFGVPKEQVAEFLGREEPKELLEQARQIIKDALEQPEKVVYYENRSGNLCEIINNPEKDGYYLMSDIIDGEPVKVTPEEFEKDWVKNDLPKLRALAQAFKNLELPDREYVYIVEFQDKPESEIIAALAWDEVATAVKDYVNSQSDENTEKLRNAYLAYPLYNELASKGIPNDEDLRRDYGKVVASEYSSFDERRTAALFVLQSVWNGRGNSTSITRSYNIDAMSAYIARTQPKYFDIWNIDGSVNERFLTKNSIFTHKHLREMGLDNNSNLAPYAPELLQEMVKIEEQYREFSQWQNQNSEGGWYNRGAENIIDFKQIPAAVQKDLILMVTHTYPLKRGMFGVYDNPVIGMQHGLAARSEVQSNLEKLIEQQEKEWQQYQKMALGVSVPQENAIVEQINLYKQTLEQVKNAPAVAFVPETLFVRGETKPDWRTGEVQRYNTTEINTATGEITFVNDKNNPNPNPFGDMTEQARQYLSANNNFALAALGVAPKEMPENVKFDDFGTTETEPRLGDETITLSNVRLPELILNAHLIGDNGHPLERNLPQFNFETPELKKEQDYISKVAKLLSDNELQKVQTLSNQLSSLRDLRQSYFDNNQGELVNDMNKHITLLERQIGNEVLGAYHNPQRLQEHIIDTEFRLIEIKNGQQADWDMRHYQSAAYLERQYKQINQNLDLRRQALQTLVNAYPHLKDIQENIAASISLDGNALKWKKEIVKDEYGFNQNQYKSNLGDFVIKELREVGAFETRHNGKGFSFKTLKATKEQVEYWYKEQQLRAEPPKTPQVKFDMFEQGVSMPTKNVEKQPANLSLWLEKNGFDFEDINSFREVFQKGNLKLAVYKEDGGDYTVSLSQFDKNIPIEEIDKQMIKPAREEQIYFFQNTDDLEKLSQYLREMEQGVTVSKTSENGVETQSETVYDKDGNIIAKPTETAVQNELNRQHGSVLSSASESQIAELVDLKLRADTIAHENTVLYKRWNGFSSYTDESNPDYNPAAVKDWQQWLKNKEPMQELNKELHQKIAHIAEQHSRIEKREEIFDILFAVSSSMSNVEHENADFRANNIWANYGNMSLMYGRFDEKTGDFKYRTYGGDDIFVINTDKISARTAATAFLRGVDEYKEKFVYGKSTALTPKKRRDIQNTVDFSIAENRRMEDISSYQDRRERLARIERQYAERETQKQTAEKSGFSSPENTVKFDDFGVVPENGNAMKIDTSLPIEEQYKQYQLAEEWISRQYSEASAAVQYLQGLKGISGFNPERLEKAITEESKFAKQLDDLRQANPEFALMARAKHLDPKDLTPELRNELQRVNEWVESQKQAAEIKQDAFGVPEKSYGQVLNEYLRLKSEMSKVDTDIQNTYDRRVDFENNPEMQGSPAHLSINSDIQRLESKYADLETQKMQIEKDYPTISQDEQKFSDLQSQLSNFSGAIERTKSNLEQLEKEFAEVQSEVVELGMEKAAVSGLDNEAVTIFSKFNLEKNSLKEAYVGKVRVLNAISEWEKSANIQLQLITPQERAKFAQELDEFLKQDAFGVPETTKTLNPKEQALADGKAMTAAEKKVSDARFDLAKQPNNTERQDAFKQAQAELAALNEEVKSRVQAAMNKGEPYVIRYDEVPTAPFNGEKAPIELVVTRSGNLRVTIGMNDTPHNLTAVDSTPEIALNAEQRSTPERTAEVLRERFNQPTAAVADQIACINYPNADKVFSEDEIKEALNRALKSSFKEHQLAAIHSPRMKDEWLECVIEKHNNPKVVATAQKVLEERQSLSSPTLSDNLEPENHTAAKGGFSSSEHEEELAIVVDDDDYGRD